MVSPIGRALTNETGLAKARSISNGGEIGIRTLDTVPRMLDFESSAFDHSAISPASRQLYRGWRAWRKACDRMRGARVFIAAARYLIVATTNLAPSSQRLVPHVRPEVTTANLASTSQRLGPHGRPEVATAGLRVPGAAALVNIRLRLPRHPRRPARPTCFRAAPTAALAWMRSAASRDRKRGADHSPLANLSPSAPCVRRVAGSRGLTARRAAKHAPVDTVGDC